MQNTIKCELCGKECQTQVSAGHLRSVHQMTTKEYRALGHQTLSPARKWQLQNTPVSRREVLGASGRFGADHPNWKGGHVNGIGYRIVYRNGRQDLEHRFIAEDMLGRRLAKDEVVHHKDGNRSNNSPDNLVVMTRHAHDQLKDGTRAHFHTGPECEEAARALFKLGWSKAKIGRALRIHHQTVIRWLAK